MSVLKNNANNNVIIQYRKKIMNTHFVYLLVNTEPSKVKRNISGFDIAND